MQPLRAVAAFLLMVLAGGAQAPSANPVTSAVRDTLQQRQKNLVAAAQEMPPDKYGFHPTPPQMTFGHLVMHIAKSNYFLCSKIAETATPQPTAADTDPKDKLVAGLKSSFEFCSAALAKVDDSKWAMKSLSGAGAKLPELPP